MSRYVPFFRQREEKEKDERKRRKRKTRRTMSTWASARWLDAVCGGDRRFALPERKADTTSEALVVIFLSEQRDDLVPTVCSTRVTDRVVSSPGLGNASPGLVSWAPGVSGDTCGVRARGWPNPVVWCGQGRTWRVVREAGKTGNRRRGRTSRGVRPP